VRPPADTAALSHALPLASGTGPARVAHVRFTSAADGDLRVDGARTVLDARRRALVAGPWTWLRQVHGSDVVTVDAPGAAAGSRADAAVTAVVGAPLAVHTADCAAVALVADGGDGAGGENGGLVAAVHAGWRGLAAGVVERAADALRDAGATGLRAVVGPCIHPCCYEFGVADLDRVAGRYGDGVRAVTTTGRHALDLPAAVARALAAAGADLVAPSPRCTACGTPPFFSHRARGDTARQAMVVWMETASRERPSRVTGRQGASDRGPSGPLRSGKSGKR
jgi:polyphenol oxidase